MQVENAVMPRGEQIRALFDAQDDGPVVMLNLLRFRETAAYPDGQDAALSGRGAYGRYAAAMKALVESQGGRLIFSGDATGMVIGTAEAPWHVVALVEYPSRAAFAAIATSDAVRAISGHRSAGLEGQLLIACRPDAF
ncbi:DUF1330 domain-containing protein [Oleomonas cavernae]|uniref:DUF1330 domain-containing protein n=1 Tax=Oleomonas cavernae TaxID=2320859 RepID=A0A418W8C9_9PROT|nr:DUF1330 domain-containing protein [Oleomonas cavernae]RJF86261.1 DUF1330 domain-containing protein [Oleomonas cavernae]